MESQKKTRFSYTLPLQYQPFSCRFLLFLTVMAPCLLWESFCTHYLCFLPKIKKTTCQWSEIKVYIYSHAYIVRHTSHTIKIKIKTAIVILCLRYKIGLHRLILFLNTHYHRILFPFRCSLVLIAIPYLLRWL